MTPEEYRIGSIVAMKKGHPCGANEWQILRVGADIKLKCLGCEHVVMIPRQKFHKRLRKVIQF